MSAAPDAGWPDCFNSGVFVFKPSEETYNAILQFALDQGSFDGLYIKLSGNLILFFFLTSYIPCTHTNDASMLIFACPLLLPVYQSKQKLMNKNVFKGGEIFCEFNIPTNDTWFIILR